MINQDIEVSLNPPFLKAAVGSSTVCNVVSLFDGMSCLQLALNSIGIKPTKYFASEIDKYAMQVTMSNFPNTIQIGDVRNVKGSDLGFVHIFGGGSPCQSFSFAGKRKGMATKCDVEILTLSHYLELKSQNFEFEGQSYLFWEYMRILEELRVINPNIKFLLENVLMGEKWQKILTRAIGINPIKINSALVSAQSRKRLYWTNIASVQDGLFGDLICSIPQPKDKGILLKDILETDVGDKYFLSEKVTSRFKVGNLNDNIVGTTKGEENTRQGQRDLVYGHNGKMGCLMSTDYKQPKQIIVHNTMPRSSKTGKGGTGPLSRNDGKTYCLDKAGCLTLAQGRAGSSDEYMDSVSKIAKIQGNIRRLTPIECERLQTVPQKELILILSICKEQIKNYVNAVEQCPKLLKLVLTVENKELSEFVKNAYANTRVSHQSIKPIVAKNVDIEMPKQTKKFTHTNPKELSLTVNNAENTMTFKSQGQEVDFVTQNAFINITEGQITHNGMAELHQKDNNSTVHLNGNKPLKLFKKEIMQLVKDVNAETKELKDMNFIFTTLLALNIKNTELMLVIFYLFAKNVITGYTQDTTHQKNLSIQFKINNGYTNHVSDTQRYKMLGNGFTVSVISHILSYIKTN